jgi:hypothetical protein
VKWRRNNKESRLWINVRKCEEREVAVQRAEMGNGKTLQLAGRQTGALKQALS